MRLNIFLTRNWMCPNTIQLKRYLEIWFFHLKTYKLATRIYVFFLLTASCHHHWKLGDVTSGIFSISDWLIYTSKIQISFLWNARVNWWANRRRERWSILILEIIKHKNVAQWTTLFLQASSPIVIHYCFLFFMLLRFAIPESSDVTT